MSNMSPAVTYTKYKFKKQRIRGHIKFGYVKKQNPNLKFYKLHLIMLAS